MTATDRKVARVLLADYPVAGLGTLAELSEKAGISAPSVIRCVKKLGFAGYPEYQRALHAEIGALVEFNTPIRAYDQTHHLPQRLRAQHSAIISAINETFALMHESEVSRSAQLVSASDRQVVVLSGFSSAPLAQAVYRGLISLRPNCELLGSDPLVRSERLIDLGKDCVLFVIDLNPRDQDLGSFVRLATERGAQVVALTDDHSTAVCERARYVLIAGSSGGANSSHVAAACLVDVLLNEVRRHIGQPARDRLRQLEAVRT